jgi:hypothetical protein
MSWPSASQVGVQAVDWLSPHQFNQLFGDNELKLAVCEYHFDCSSVQDTRLSEHSEVVKKCKILGGAKVLLTQRSPTSAQVQSCPRECLI